MRTTVVGSDISQPTSTRRAARRSLLALVALTMSALLGGCASLIETTDLPDRPAAEVTPADTATPAATSDAAATSNDAATSDNVAIGTVVMIIRHGEKPEDDTAVGLDANGVEDDSSLTTVGWDRAHRLVDLFDPAGADPRPGLARPKAIYAAGANENGEGQRTRETVQPLAARLGIPVNTDFGKGDGSDLVEHLASQPGPVLISWQHSEIPEIAEAFGAVTPTPPTEWPDDRYDVIWTLTKAADGWHFAQLPELVLPQDQDNVIED